MRKNSIIKKDIDLLKVYQVKKEPSKYHYLIKAMIFPALVVIISAIVFTILMLDNNRINSKINNTQNKIDKLAEKINVSAEYSDSLTKLMDQSLEYNSLYENLKSYPTLLKVTIDQAYISLPVGVSISGVSYNNDSQTLSVAIGSVNSLDLEAYVRNMKGSGMYKDIEYTGYQLVERQSEAAEGDKPAVTSSVYETTISCFLK